MNPVPTSPLDDDLITGPSRLANLPTLIIVIYTFLFQRNKLKAQIQAKTCTAGFDALVKFAEELK